MRHGREGVHSHAAFPKAINCRIGEVGPDNYIPDEGEGRREQQLQRASRCEINKLLALKRHAEIGQLCHHALLCAAPGKPQALASVSVVTQARVLASSWAAAGWRGPEALCLCRCPGGFSEMDRAGGWLAWGAPGAFRGPGRTPAVLSGGESRKPLGLGSTPSFATYWLMAWDTWDSCLLHQVRLMILGGLAIGSNQRVQTSPQHGIWCRAKADLWNLCSCHSAIPQPQPALHCPPEHPGAHLSQAPPSPPPPPGLLAALALPGLRGF